MNETARLYSDLAWLWPLWGDPAEEYAEYCGYVCAMIDRHAERPVRSMLVIGCGGGKNVFNLKRSFEVTGLDISPAMLDQARAMNPECRFIQADMRAFSLDQLFDAILIDDAISHMHKRADFEAAISVAARHLAPGGVLITTPDATRETFRHNETTTTTVERDGLVVTFVENVFDPDPDDEHYETTIVYLIREQGRLRIETDHWTLGLFTMATWRRALADAELVCHEHAFELDGVGYTSLVGVLPA